MIQLAPNDATAGLDPAVAQLRRRAEFPKIGETVYVIARSPSGDLEPKAREVNGTTLWCFPFVKLPPAGPQAGPVFKRGKHSKDGGTTPKLSTLERSLNAFLGVALAGGPGAAVYRAALEVLGPLPVSESSRFGAEGAAQLFGALSRVPPGFYVSLGELPPADKGFAQHLLELLRKRSGAETVVGDASPDASVCPLCGMAGPRGAMGLPAAKINFLNNDDQGFFPGFDESRADARFAICDECGGALRSCYISLKSGLLDVRLDIAGAPAMVFPYIVAPAPGGDASRSARDVVVKARAGKRTDVAEDDLLDDLARESSLATFHVLWANTGDSLGSKGMKFRESGVMGAIAHVPCTRLTELSRVNKLVDAWTGGVLPARHMRRPLDLRLSLVGELLQHPGVHAERRNKGERLGALRKRIARAVYLVEPLDLRPLLRESRDIIAEHLLDRSLDDRFLVQNLTREAVLTRKGEITLNSASWIRHFALLLHYLRHLKVLRPMTTGDRYTPRSERLRRLLEAPSGVDTDEKLFGFLVGILFGHLLFKQWDEGRNVRSNALTWLRHARLTGTDLPGLYVRIRQKFSEYEAEKWSVVREVVLDASEVGKRLGTASGLDADTTMYFLFLGQALAGDVFAKDSDTPPTAPSAPTEPR